VLTPQEADALLEIVDRLRSEGAGIVLISHKLREVRAIADRVTVLRGGRVVFADLPAADADDLALVRAMVGEAVVPVENSHAGVGVDDAVLEARGLRLIGASGAGLRDLGLEVGRGEILGIAGVAGNGQRELVDVLTGSAVPDAGDVYVNGERLRPDPRSFRAAGVLSVAADPLREFVVPGLTVGEHAALWDAASAGKRLRFDIRVAGRRLLHAAGHVGLAIAHPDRRLDRLSGGNIQRVLLALAFGEPATALVASYPTRGLDVRTAERTRALLLAARDAGTAIVLVSEDIDELLALSDRIAVLVHGHVHAVVGAADADRQSVGRLMTGAKAA
jgi:simple sugar transport system ATP-binding protein